MQSEAWLDAQQRDAFEKAQLALEELGASSLSEDELTAVGSGQFKVGWKLRVELNSSQTHTIAVLLPNSFPYELPRMAVLDAPPLLTWPHLEEGNLLCVLPSGTSPDPALPAAQVKALVNDGLKLLLDIVAGRVDQDYLEEFTAYWKRGADNNAQKYISLLNPGGEHREIWIWRGAKEYIVAETEAHLRSWLTHRYGSQTASSKTLSPTLFLKLSEAISPDAYPQTAADVRRLFSGDKNALRLIASQAHSEKERDVVLGVPTPTGAGFAPITINAATTPRIPGKAGVNQLWKGFRPGGKMPEEIAVLRATTPASTIVRHTLERADHDWVHGRDNDPRQATLKESSVLIVGCGSLGSSVAEIVARAGVGRLTLMDGETLDWTNPSRHALGMDSVHEYKASSLANRISAGLPHLAKVEAIDQRLTTANVRRLSGYDLVIATTGLWAVDSLINASQQEQDIPVVLYSWLEPHAAAAHAVTIPKGSVCLACQFSGNGLPALSVSHWPNSGTLPIPSCAGNFTPYGAAELAYAHAMVSEEALDIILNKPNESREVVWVGKTSRWLAMGGEVSEAWTKAVGDPKQGGFVTYRPWLRSATCPICGTRPA